MTFPRWRCRNATLLVLLLQLVSGCSGGSGPLPELAEVTGSVTLDGKPLEGAHVLFEPESGDRPSSGLTDDDGYFELMFNADTSGAVLGRHTVRIGKMGGESETDELLPINYNEESELTVRVMHDSPNEFTFELESE